MSYKEFVIKHFFVIKSLTILVGIAIMFYAMFFSDKPPSFETIKNHIDDPMMYLCLMLSSIASFIIGLPLNKKNLSKK